MGDKYKLSATNCLICCTPKIIGQQKRKRVEYWY